MTKFCTVCSSYVPEPCTDPDCPIQDDLDECDNGVYADGAIESLNFDDLQDSDYFEPELQPEEDD